MIKASVGMKIPTYTSVHARKGTRSHVTNHSIVLNRQVAHDVSLRDMEGVAFRSRHGHFGPFEAWVL